MRMNTFAKMSATLMYSFWKGLPEAMYHIDGGRPCCVQTIAPSTFIDCQNRVTRMVFKTCEEYMGVADWYADPSGEFTTEGHLQMLRNSVVRMQSNNRSQKQWLGLGKRDGDANWGGHGAGEEKRFVEPSNDECPIDERDLRENDLICTAAMTDASQFHAVVTALHIVQSYSDTHVTALHMLKILSRIYVCCAFVLQVNTQSMQ